MQIVLIVKVQMCRCVGVCSTIGVLPDIILGLLARAYGFLSSPPADSGAAVGLKMFFTAQARLIALLTWRLHRG